MNKKHTSLRGLLGRREARYGIVGATVYGLELAVIFGAQAAGLGVAAAVGVSYVVGLTVSFLLQKLFAFGDKRMHKKIVFWQAVAVGALVIWNFCFTVAAAFALQHVLPAAAIRTIALLVTTLWNYYIYKTYIFRPHPKQTAPQPSLAVSGRPSTHGAHSPAMFWRPLLTPSRRLRLGLGRTRTTLHSTVLQQLRARWRRGAAWWWQLVGMALLGASTFYWAVLGAVVQSSNADQLVNVYLFENFDTFRLAVFPGAHTFLLKWPIFWVTAVAGGSERAIVVATVAVTAAAVAGIAYGIWRIETRPQMRAALYLACSLLLLQVPPQAHDGSLLPVAMTMLTTRNVEYIVCIAALLAVARARRLGDRAFWAATGLLVLVFASDRLFLGLSAGGALAVLAVYGAARRRSYVQLGFRWLGATVVAAIASSGVLAAMRLASMPVISSSEHSPYVMVTSAKTLLLAVFYALSGMATQLGANPIYDVTTIRSMPAALVERLAQPGGLGYIAAMLTAAALVWWAGRLVASTLTAPAAKRTSKKTLAAVPPPPAVSVTVMLWAMSLAAVGLFAGTTHYYAADSRYLAIVFFAVVLGAATALRTRQFSDKALRAVCVGGLICVPFAGYNALYAYHTQSAAYSDTRQQNDAVRQFLRRSNIRFLVGDYWRVIPIHGSSRPSLTVYPLQNCTTPSEVLTSAAWRPPVGERFAYLLSGGPSVTGFPNCTLPQLYERYGPPIDSVTLPPVGTRSAEKIVVFNGYRGPDARRYRSALEPPGEYAKSTPPTTACATGKTYVSVIAHQDDDLLFMNPDIQTILRDGNCVRTVYLTAGDSGGGTEYEATRLKGAQAAYDTMLGQPQRWRHAALRVPGGGVLSYVEPLDNTQVTLFSLRLPDGSLFGEGFAATNYRSLRHILDGNIQGSSIPTLDRARVYTAEGIVRLIVHLFTLYRPVQVQTFETTPHYPADHSDHSAAGVLTQTAVTQYDSVSGQLLPVVRYSGYPMQAWPQNLSDDDVHAKETVFLSYAPYDAAVCQTLSDCYSHSSTYGLYLRRQYRSP